jgi:tRNA dimethylallyltransferase
MTGIAPLTVILGPTASGKSALAYELARQASGEILSVDSMTIYREMDIGTAKPSTEERAKVKHHLIDLIDPDKPFAVAKFVELADSVIAATKSRNVPLIATGGTPLYYKALFEGLFDGPGSNEAVRLRFAEMTNDSLHLRLAEVDSVASTRIHSNDRKRMIRALEVFELTGKPISSFQTEWENPRARHQARWFGLNWDKETLNRRINQRVKQMISAGWVEETRSLLSKYGTLSKTASEATGYYEIIQHLQGKLKLDDAIELIKIATRQLARKQMKWFRRFPNVTWLAGDAPMENLLEKIAADERG